MSVAAKTCIAFGLASFVAFWIGCGGGGEIEQGAEGSSRPERRESGLPAVEGAEDSGVAPTAALIVVRDLGAFWQDCGCSGNATGGVGRYRAAAHGSPDLTYLFVGRTTLPLSNGSKGAIDAATQSSASWYAALAVQVFKSLGSVIWIPDANELAAHKEAGNATLLDYAVAREALQWRSFAIEVEPDELKLPTFKRSVPLPKALNRGRDIGILGLWDRRTTQIPTFMQELGTPLSMADRNPDNLRRTRELLASSSSTLMTYWRREVTSELGIEREVDAAAGGMTLLIAHSPGTVRPAYLIADGRSVTVSFFERECGSCHEKAISTWALSRHSGSMDTLRTKGRESDPRCVPCHASAFTVQKPGTVLATPGHDAVTCMSCHHERVKAKDACTQCHTSVTDPKSRFWHWRQSICVPGQTKVGAICRRDVLK